MKTLFLIALSVVFLSCSAVKIGDVDYGWAAEYYGTPTKDFKFEVPKHSMTLGLKTVFRDEGILDDPSKYIIRIIRDSEGYYFLTGEKFHNVWVLEWDTKSMKVYKKIFLDEIIRFEKSRFFNEKKPVVAIVSDGTTFEINKDGLIKK